MAFRSKHLMLCAIVTGPVALAGCGYTLVKKRDLAKHTQLVVDSTEVVQLRTQLGALQARYVQDSAHWANTPPSVAAVTNGTRDSIVKVRDAEIASLKDQLAKATDELERIKRRLATPR